MACVTVSRPGGEPPRFSRLVEENVAAQGGSVRSLHEGDRLIHEIRLPILAEAA
jgi:hypothetical protein